MPVPVLVLVLVLEPIAFSTESSAQGVVDYIAEFPVGYHN